MKGTHVLSTTSLRARAQRKSAKGQTLIELMVVVVIIAIIAGALLLNYAHAKSQATVAVTQTNLKEIAAAIESYETDNGAYPASGNVTGALFGANSTKYLPGTPASPGTGGGQYVYTLDATGQYYTITDPATYDTVSMGPLPQGAAPAAGIEAATTGAKCSVANTCKQVGYSNAVGLFGY